jgi:hypothetical protein
MVTKDLQPRNSEIYIKEFIAHQFAKTPVFGCCLNEGHDLQHFNYFSTSLIANWQNRSFNPEFISISWIRIMKLNNSVLYRGHPKYPPQFYPLYPLPMFTRDPEVNNRFLNQRKWALIRDPVELRSLPPCSYCNILMVRRVSLFSAVSFYSFLYHHYDEPSSMGLLPFLPHFYLYFITFWRF